jgi:hypothetical protein
MGSFIFRVTTHLPESKLGGYGVVKEFFFVLCNSRRKMDSLDGHLGWMEDKDMRTAGARALGHDLNISASQRRCILAGTRLEYLEPLTDLNHDLVLFN